jgi:hypothetical protein
MITPVTFLAQEIQNKTLGVIARMRRQRQSAGWSSTKPIPARFQQPMPTSGSKRVSVRLSSLRFPYGPFRGRKVRPLETGGQYQLDWRIPAFP